MLSTRSEPVMTRDNYTVLFSWTIQYSERCYRRGVAFVKSGVPWQDLSRICSCDSEMDTVAKNEQKKVVKEMRRL